MFDIILDFSKEELIFHGKMKAIICGELKKNAEMDSNNPSQRGFSENQSAKKGVSNVY